MDEEELRALQEEQTTWERETCWGRALCSVVGLLENLGECEHGKACGGQAGEVALRSSWVSAGGMETRNRVRVLQERGRGTGREQWTGGNSKGPQ